MGYVWRNFLANGDCCGGVPQVMNDLPTSDPTRLLSDLDFVRSLARHLCGDVHEAEDVAQDAMLVVLEARPGEVASWRGWLSVVTRNLALNRRRSER
jgi:DNA-directed RNA polymerase specialized sigma24 family protein